MTALERYRTIYETFNQYSLKRPEIYYNLFFGKHSDRLPAIIKQYYELFPNELEGQHPTVRNMLQEGNMYLRDLSIVQDLANEGIISIQNVPMVVNIVPRLQQTYLYEAYLNTGKIDTTELHLKFMETLDYIIKTAK